MITCTDGLSRRRLLQPSALTSLGVTRVASAVTEHPVDRQRIVALEWRPVELLMALGIMPLAVAEIGNYRRWVMEPLLPATTTDVGLRNEPNMELLQRLQPSLCGFTARPSQHCVFRVCWPIN